MELCGAIIFLFWITVHMKWKGQSYYRVILEPRDKILKSKFLLLEGFLSKNNRNFITVVFCEIYEKENDVFFYLSKPWGRVTV